VTTSTVRAAVAAAIALLTAVAAASDDGPAFGVAVLRRDGVLVPFAAFNGRRWSSPWPQPSLDFTVPVDLRAVPSRWWGPTRALDVWDAVLVPSTGAATRQLRVVQPDWVGVHCVRQIGLRTDYVPAVAVPPPTVQPYPKDGLAISPPQPIEPIAIVPPGGDAAQMLAPALLDAFNRAERVVESRYTHPINRRLRERVAPAMEAVYAFGDEPRTFYVEAIRPYRALGQSADECSAIAFGSGWFVREAGHVRSLVTTVDLLACDRAGASYMLPLGVMRIGSRLFWLAQFSGWDHERFAILEIKPKTVEAAISVWGGGC
jgi:hypothetical protein